MEVRISGKNFVSTATATFNGLDRKVSHVDDTHLILNLRPLDLSTPGTFVIVVTNPSPGGGAATAHLTVTAPTRSE